jgi:hypothetical protein
MDPLVTSHAADELPIPEAGSTEDVLSVYLSKYESMRAETASRFQFQVQTFNFLVVVLTAFVVASASMLESGQVSQFERLILALPLIAGPLGYLYVSNDLMIFGIAGYLDRGLSREVSAIVGRDLVLTDARLAYLSRRGGATLAALGYSRWLLFVVPTVVPVAYAALATDGWRELPFSLLFVADCLIALGLLAAIWMTALEQVDWVQEHSRQPTAPMVGPAVSSTSTSEHTNEASAGDRR